MLSEDGERVPFTGAARVEADRGHDQLTLRFAGITMEQFTDGRHMYIQADLLRAGVDGVPADARWVRIDQDKMLAALNTDLSAFREMQNHDPARQLEVLHSLATEIETLGEDRVQGVDVTHYSMAIPVGDVLSKGGSADVSEEVEDLEFEYEVWIDDRARIRRAGIETVVEGGGIDMTMELAAQRPGLSVQLPSGPGLYEITEEGFEPYGN